jgi:hypothetical protein
MGGSRSVINRRTRLGALLDKAVSGDRFKELAQRYGIDWKTLQTQAHRWLKAGVRAEAMTLLKDMKAVPAWQPDPVEILVSLKPLAIESIVGDGEPDRWRTGRRRRTRCGRRRPAGSRRARRPERAPRGP